jgi:hypothetical protein
VKLLSSDKIGNSLAIMALISDLLETCSNRLVRFESLPMDSSNPSIVFLNEDVDTIPERHAFLGNYARFCNQIVELVVQKQPIDALYHILGQADQVLDHVYDGEPPFQGMEAVRIAHDFSILIVYSFNLHEDIYSLLADRCSIHRYRGCAEGLLEMAHRPREPQNSKSMYALGCQFLTYD